MEADTLREQAQLDQSEREEENRFTLEQSELDR